MDTSARIGEIGRPPAPEADWFYAAHRRLFEPGERDIEHPQYPIAGRWLVDAVDLPPAVLAKLYRENARRLIGR